MIKAFQGIPGRGMTYQTPRQSSAYLLAIAQLDEFVAARRGAASSLAAQPLADAAPAAGVQTLPDGNHGNHGETLEVTTP